MDRFEYVCIYISVVIVSLFPCLVVSSLTQRLEVVDKTSLLPNSIFNISHKDTETFSCSPTVDK